MTDTDPASPPQTSTITLSGDGGTTTFNGVITDQGGSSPGAISGADSLVISGLGIVVLKPENADGSAAVNSYTGGTEIEGGTLDLAAAGAAGSGAITFAPSGDPATLQIDAAALPASGLVFSNVISGFTGSDTINLSGVPYDSGGVATLLSGNLLQVSEDGQTYDFQLDPRQDFSGQHFQLSDPVGTDIKLVANPPVASVLANTTPAQISVAEAPVTPFADATVSDGNANNPTDTLTITPSGNGGTLSYGGTVLTPSNGAYTLTGSAAALTMELQALSFRPAAAGTPSGSAVTSFVLSDSNSANATPVINSTSQVVETDAASTVTSVNHAPIIGGTAAGQATTDAATISPFAAVTIADPDVGQTETATVSFATANGTVSDSVGAAGAGSYTMSGTTSQVQAALQALVFTPTANQVTPGQTVTTGFTLSVSDGVATTTDTNTSVVAASVNDPPVIAGVSPTAQAITDASTATPFSAVTVTDPDVGQINTATVNFNAANGTVSDSFGAASDGSYTVSGTTAELQTALRGLVFSPTPGQTTAGSSVTTGFALSVSDGLATVANSSATVVATAISHAQPVTATPTLGVASSSGSTVSNAVVDSGSAITLLGTAAAGATVSVSDNGSAVGQTVAAADGTYSLALGSVGLGQNTFTAVAAASGEAASAAATSGVFALPTTDPEGVSTADISSLDLSKVLGSGYKLQFLPGTEAVQAVDGTLSVGPDTNQALVQRLYAGLLGRGSDPGGLANYSEALSAGATPGSVASTLLSSAEYAADHGTQTDSQYLNSLYQGLLGRAPDPSGFSTYTNALAAGATRADVAVTIANSPEAKTYNAGATAELFVRDPNGTVVHELFETGLAREVDLTAIGPMSGALASGAETPLQLAQFIVGSPEFMSLHAGQSDTAFVTSLYQSGLGRAPDPTGLQSYVGALGSGAATRAGVLLAISTSPEAATHLTGNFPPFTAAAPLTAQPVTATPTLGVASSSGSTVSNAVVDSGSAITLLGTAAAGATVSVSDNGSAVGQTVAAADGTYSLALGSVGLGQNTFTAVAAASGEAASAAATSGVFALPTTDPEGVSTADISSLDLSKVLGSGYKLQFLPGTEAVQAVDGTLSVGPDTNQALVQRLYAGLLGRGSDPGGLANYSEALSAGATPGSVASTLLSSAEYAADHGTQTDSQYLNSLYQGLLGRAPDPSGFSTYTNALAAGATRADVAVTIANSPEAKTYNAGATAELFVRDPNGTVVHELFETGLAREVDLTAIGPMSGALASGAETPLQLAQFIVGSPEFMSLHAGQSDTAFVTSLYQSGLGRAPDPTGLQSYVGALGSGAATRAGVLLAISTSPEAATHLTGNF